MKSKVIIFGLLLLGSNLYAITAKQEKALWTTINENVYKTDIKDYDSALIAKTDKAITDYKTALPKSGRINKALKKFDGNKIEYAGLLKKRAFILAEKDLKAKADTVKIKNLIDMATRLDHLAKIEAEVGNIEATTTAVKNLKDVSLAATKLAKEVKIEEFNKMAANIATLSKKSQSYIERAKEMEKEIERKAAREERRAEEEEKREAAREEREKEKEAARIRRLEDATEDEFGASGF